jgi:hypothetical protein
MPIARPTVNLDALGALLDRAADHPLAKLAGELSPALAARARVVRERLPEVAGMVAYGIEERAIGHLRDEARALEAEAVDAIDTWLANAILGVKVKTRRPKRLKALKKKAKR